MWSKEIGGNEQVQYGRSQICKTLKSAQFANSELMLENLIFKFSTVLDSGNREFWLRSGWSKKTIGVGLVCYADYEHAKRIPYCCVLLSDKNCFEISTPDKTEYNMFYNGTKICSLKTEGKLFKIGQIVIDDKHWGEVISKHKHFVRRTSYCIERDVVELPITLHEKTYFWSFLLRSSERLFRLKGKTVQNALDYVLSKHCLPCLSEEDKRIWFAVEILYRTVLHNHKFDGCIT